jgi:CBS domain-containing protein
MAIRSLRSMVAGQRPLCVAGDVPVAEVARRMHEERTGAALVLDGTRLAGIFTERDALFRVLAEARDPRSTPVGGVMTRDPQTIHPDKPFEEALRLMYEGRFRHVPVVEDGRPLGIVSVREAIHPDFTALAQVIETHEVARE